MPAIETCKTGTRFRGIFAQNEVQENTLGRNPVSIGFMELKGQILAHVLIDMRDFAAAIIR